MRRGKRKHAGETDFELNLASIIDCFTVLITYLLVSASFISLGILDVSVPVMASSASTVAEPGDTLAVKISGDGSIRVALHGSPGIPPEVTVPAKEGRPDFGAFAAAVASMADRAPAMDTASVTADPTVEYRSIVKAIETLKPRLPNVAIGEND